MVHIYSFLPNVLGLPSWPWQSETGRPNEAQGCPEYWKGNGRGLREALVCSHPGGRQTLKDMAGTQI